MLRGYLRLGSLVLVTMVLSTGCAGTGHPRKAGPPPAPAPSSQPQADARVDLKAVLLPPRAQDVHIHLTEHRTTNSPQTDSVTQVLELELRAILKPGKTEADGSVRAVLEVTHTSLRTTTPTEPVSMLTYDSRKDKAGKGNRLADLMAIVADVKLALKIAPDGRLVELRGLDAKWRAAGIIMAPPDLLAVQWLFRDNSMQELVSEALFPPMPATAKRTGDSWNAEIPASIPLAAQLTSHLRFELSPGEDADRTSGSVRVKAAGQIKPTKPLLDAPPAIQPAVNSASHTVQIQLNPESGLLRQKSTRTLDVDLTLTPPSGNDRLKMKLRQDRQMIGERFPAKEAQ